MTWCLPCLAFRSQICLPPPSDLSASSLWPDSIFFCLILLQPFLKPGVLLSLGFCFCSSLCLECSYIVPWAVPLHLGLWSKVTFSAKSFLTTYFKRVTCLLISKRPLLSPDVYFLVHHVDTDINTYEVFGFFFSCPPECMFMRFLWGPRRVLSTWQTINKYLWNKWIQNYPWIDNIQLTLPYQHR